MKKPKSISGLSVFACLVTFALLFIDRDLSPRENPGRGDPAAGRQTKGKLNTATTATIMDEIRRKYKTNRSRYIRLERRILRSLEKRLKTAEWNRDPRRYPPGKMTEHPTLLMIQELSDALLKNGKSETGRPEIKQGASIPLQCEELEYTIGLRDGSDREIATNRNGFIDLGDLSSPSTFLSGVKPNSYMYGLGEVIGWRYCVKGKRNVEFKGLISRKNNVKYEKTAPPWESIRLYLDGVLPEAVLFAYPQLVMELDGRLRPKLAGNSQGTCDLQNMLLYLDSKWNGYYYRDSYSRADLFFTKSIHDVFTRKDSYVRIFTKGNDLVLCGDVPFVSLRTFQEYSKVFCRKNVEIVSFLRNERDAAAVRTRFKKECTYLARYKCLVELFAHAILFPNSPFPGYLKNYDYQEDLQPARTDGWIDSAYDMPRKHALMIWALAGKDIDKTAGFLRKHVLQSNEEEIELETSLPIKMTLTVRKLENEILRDIAEKLTGSANSPESPAPETSEANFFRSEFSPYYDPHSSDGNFNSDNLARSHWQFNRSLADFIRETALECVYDEIGDKWTK